MGAHTVVVMVGDGAEWIWNRAGMFVRPCEIFDFWHALEHAWEFAQFRYGEGSAQTDRWVHQIAEDLWAGKVQEVIARLKRVRSKTPELRESLQALIRYVRRPFGGMPAFTAKVLSDQELTDIYAYLKSFPPAKPAKDIPLLRQIQ